MTTPHVRQRPSQTKIVATVGPACADSEKLVQLIAAGVDVFRVNTAHGTREEHQQRVDAIRAAARRAGQLVAILADLAGPKIRLGPLPGDLLECPPGSRVRFVRGETPRGAEDLTTTYGPLVDELNIGDRVVLADGTVALSVEAKDADSALCRVVQGGLLRSRQGVNLPGVKLSVEALGPRDRDNAVWAARQGLDFVGLSFVRTTADVHELKAILAAENAPTQVIAKIEKPEAVENIESIVQAADGIMVARGDLGVETDIALVPVVQKQIVQICHRYRRPVIVATQMLDSMQQSRIPTRAEATDVANAILDGADACMLSGETAIGSYPIEAVETMHRIAVATESFAQHRPLPSAPDLASPDVKPVTEGTVWAAGSLGAALNAKMIVVASASGQTALSLSKSRHYLPTIGVSESDVVLRRMCLYWGVIPLPAAPVDNSRALLEFVVESGRQSGYLASGDRLVLIAGTGIRASRHNMIVVHELD